MDNYAKIVYNNLERIFQEKTAEDLIRCLPGKAAEAGVSFRAFGETCRLLPSGVFLGEKKEEGVRGIIITLYALHCGPEAVVLEPFTAFKEIPGSAPYAGAFIARTQNPLIAHVDTIQQKQREILKTLDGEIPPDAFGGDFAFILRPLPKISLCCIFYEADEDFPASATCLYSANAAAFIPVDGLADTGEYTTARILACIA